MATQVAPPLDNAAATRTPPNQSLYIQNLPEKLQKADLKRTLYMLFTTYGPVLDVTAVKTSKMRGQAHVLFRDVQSATQAMRHLNGFEFFGREMVSTTSSLQLLRMNRRTMLIYCCRKYPMRKAALTPSQSSQAHLLIPSLPVKRPRNNRNRFPQQVVPLLLQHFLHLLERLQADSLHHQDYRKSQTGVCSPQRRMVLRTPPAPQ